MQAPLVYPEQDYRFDHLRLRFRNPGVEQTFVRETLEQSINFVRVYLIAGTCLYICFGVLDMIVGGDLLPALWTIRYGVVCPILLGIFTLTFFPLFYRVAQPALALAMLASGLGIVVMTAIMHAPFNSNYYAGLIMVVIYCGSLIRLKFFHSLWISVFLIAAYQATHTYPRPMARATYDEVLAIGALNTLADVATRERVSTYYVLVETSEITFRNVPLYRDLVRSVIPYRVQERIRTACAETLATPTSGNGLAPAALPEHCSLGLPPAEIASAAAQLAQTAGLKRDLTRVLADLDQKLIQVDRSALRARQLAAALSQSR